MPFDSQLSLQQRTEQGQDLRSRFDLNPLRHPTLRPDRLDPLALHGIPDEGRLEDYIPIRYGRMLENEFSFYRGSAGAMAYDLSTLPRSGVEVQLCGDTHLMNFGVFASPERQLMFDLNDFDETMPGPFEWDLIRLVTSAAIAARVNGQSPEQVFDVARRTARAYRKQMGRFASLSHLELWYHHVDSEKALKIVRHVDARLKDSFKSARKRTARNALLKLAERQGDTWHFRHNPPEVVQVDEGEQLPEIRSFFEHYLDCLQGDRQMVLRKYRFVDAAFKLTGTGSAGRRVYMALLQGNNPDDVLILQLKQAFQSVLEEHLGEERHAHNGERIVHGQRLMQSTSDIFLGWSTLQGQEYYVRQLRDMKGSVDIGGFSASDLCEYSKLCAYVLARAHARSGDAAVLSGFLEDGHSFDEALAQFAVHYAEVNRQDYDRLLAAEQDGTLKVQRGI